MFSDNSFIDEQILKPLIYNNVLPTDPAKKVRLIIFYKKFKTSNLIISNNLSLSTGPSSYICLNVTWETVSPKKIVRMLVFILRLFPDDLQCT